MSPYFPSGHRELADWSGDCMTDNTAVLHRSLPDSPEEREILVLIAQVDTQLLTECLLLTFTCICMPVRKQRQRQFRFLPSLVLF